MTDVQDIYAELGKLDKDVLVEIIVSGKLPDDLQNSTVSDYLKKNSKLLLNSSKQSMEDVSDCDESTMAIDDRHNSAFSVSDYEVGDWGSNMDKSNVVNKNLTGVFWKDFVNGKIPADAVESVDGKYIGQVRYENKLLPACIFPDSRLAVAERYGKRVIMDNIKILCSEHPNRVFWEEIDLDGPSSNQMKNAFVGGYQDGYELYIGKICWEGEWKIGKVVPLTPYKGIQIWNKSDDFVMHRQFYILKYSPVTTCNEDGAIQDVVWRNFMFNKVPNDSFKAVLDKSIYIGQVHHYENVLPVAIYPQDNVAIGERNGKVQFYKEIQILCALDITKFYWEEVDFRNATEDVMKNAVKGGYQDGYNLYIGRAYYRGEWKVGKVVPMSNVGCKGLQVWNDHNHCLRITEFELLKYYGNNALANRVYYSPRYNLKKKHLNVLPRCRSFLRVFFKQLTPPCCSGPKHYTSNLLYCNAEQEYYWSDYILHNMPREAVKGGDRCYIGQVKYEKHILPACIYPLKGMAVAERYGKRVFMENIKILCCPNSDVFTWDYVNFDSNRSIRQLEDAFVGGYQDGYDLYVGKVLMNGEWNVGKVVPHFITPYKGLQVIDENSEFKMFRKFYLLKYNPRYICRKSNGISKV